MDNITVKNILAIIRQNILKLSEKDFKNRYSHIHLFQQTEVTGRNEDTTISNFGEYIIKPQIHVLPQ